MPSSWMHAATPDRRGEFVIFYLQLPPLRLRMNWLCFTEWPNVTDNVSPEMKLPSLQHPSGFGLRDCRADDIHELGTAHGIVYRFHS